MAGVLLAMMSFESLNFLKISKCTLFPTDFNEDDYICESDLKRVIQRLCGEQRLSDDNVNALIQKVKT